MNDQNKNSGDYDRKTIVGAAIAMFVFVIMLYFLPKIMLIIGATSQVGALVAIGFVLALPFIALWLRGRSRR